MKNMNYMKNSLIVLLFLLLFLQSCDGFLDTAPSNSVTTDLALLTIRDANFAVNGLYRPLKAASFYGGTMTLMGDNRGDDFLPRNSNVGGWNELYAFRYTSENLNQWGIWGSCYNTIMKANAILEGWESLQAQTADQIAQKNDIKAHALAVRAFTYFDLVRLYGYPYLKDNGQSMGAIIVDKTITPKEALEMERSTVADTYSFLLKDIQEALPLIFKPSTLSEANAQPNPASERPGRIGKFNYWSLKMLQARAYLYMGQWDNAYSAAIEVIRDSPYRLVSHSEYINDLGTEGGVETIFELLVGGDRETDMDANNNFDGMYNSFWHISPGMARLVPSIAWVELMEEDPDDVRCNYISWYNGSEDLTWIKKFPGIGGDFKRNNPRIFRLSEAYFIAAETALATGKQSEANQYLDAIRKRANPANPTITCTLDELLKEKRKEFIGEGHRFYDLMRLGKTMVRSGGIHFAHYVYECPETIDWNYFKVVLPVSRSARLLHPLCKQNPGYTD